LFYPDFAVISYYISLSFRGSLKDYKFHVDLEIVNTVQTSNKNICLRSIVRK
jgi:hypothetical protein